MTSAPSERNFAATLLPRKPQPPVIKTFRPIAAFLWESAEHSASLRPDDTAAPRFSAGLWRPSASIASRQRREDFADCRCRRFRFSVRPDANHSAITRNDL